MFLYPPLVKKKKKNCYIVFLAQQLLTGSESLVLDEV